MTIVDAGSDEAWGVATATFDDDRLYRYSLTRVWDSSLPTTVFVMLNPSTADAFKVDPTVRRCLGFAQAWGSGGLVVLNAFALRSTDPLALYGHRDPVGPENDRVIRETLERYQPAQVVAGWGEHAAKISRYGARRPAVPRGQRPGSWQSRASEIAAMLGDSLLALKVTKDGNPGHPLYLPGTAVPLPWSPP